MLCLGLSAILEMGAVSLDSSSSTGFNAAARRIFHGMQIGVVVGASRTALIILSPPVEWWVDNLPDLALGGYGAFLVLIGSALQTVQYIMPLFSS